MILFLITLSSCGTNSKKQVSKETYKYEIIVNFTNGEKDTLVYFSNVLNENFRIYVNEEIPYLKSLETILAADVRSFSVLNKEKIK